MDKFVAMSLVMERTECDDKDNDTRWGLERAPPVTPAYHLQTLYAVKWRESDPYSTAGILFYSDPSQRSKSEYTNRKMHACFESHHVQFIPQRRGSIVK